MDQMRHRDPRQPNCFHGAVARHEGVQLHGELAGLWSVEDSKVAVALDVRFDEVGQLEG